MLAGVRNVAFGATIVMAGQFVVMLAERAWMFLFLPPPDAPFFDGGPEPWLYIGGLWSPSGYAESLIGVAVMIWLVGRMVRCASK
jgi:hypothetical protein